MLQLLKEILLEVIKAFAPLILVVCALQFTLVKAPLLYCFSFSLVR